MYMVLATWWDIWNIVAALSSYDCQLFPRLMTTTERVFLYLKYRADFQLHFNHNCNHYMNCNTNAIGIWYHLEGYSDSTGANTSIHCKPQRGNIFITCKVNTVLWHSWKQGVITLSTSRLNLLPLQRLPVKWNGFSHCNSIFTIFWQPHHDCQSTATITKLALSSPQET